MSRPRQSRRFAVQLPTLIRQDGESRQATTLNLSIHGCAITADELPPVGAYLAWTADPLDGTPPLAAELAAVRWISSHRCGLEFIRVTPDMALRLKSFVAILETTP
jgi:hypothetical protein